MEKTNRLQRIIETLLWLMVIALGGYIILKGFTIVKEELLTEKSTLLAQVYAKTQEKAVKAYLPGLLAADAEEEEPAAGLAWVWEQVTEQIPFLAYVKEDEGYKTAVESSGTYEKIVEENSDFLQAKILEENQEAGPVGAGEENTGEAAPEDSTQTKDNEQTQSDEPKQDNGQAQGNEQIQDTEKMQESGQEQMTANNNDTAQEENQNQEAAITGGAGRALPTDIPLEKFQDYDFVIGNYFTIDKTTTINSEQLNAPKLVNKDLRMTTPNDQPQILIYHSHSQEEFADSIEGDASTTVVGVGEYLASLLRDTYGYNVLHITDVFDMVDGELDRNKAYNYARDHITKVLEDNPSVEVVIDLHRDGVAKGKKLVSEVNGKPTAQIMFFNGLSRTTKNGDIESLYNPYIEDNLAFSLQLQLQAEKHYPGLTRNIYLKGYRYNLHLRPKALLLECGAQTNTVEEEMNAMEPFADILNKVLKGE